MGVRHEVLNAKNHEREAFIVAQAGRKGAVTVSTNMAGRGTDILLGGNPEFMAKERLRKENKDPDAMQTAAFGTPERRNGTSSSRASKPKRRRSTTKWWRWAGCTFWAPSGTIRGASTTSFADAPDARAIPAARVSISRCRTI